MKCPIDTTDLVMTERQGIEIDYCPNCRGVWLDRGELDKIIERSVAASAQPPFLAPQAQAAPPHRPQASQEARDRHNSRFDEHDHERHDARYEQRHKGRRSSFLGTCSISAIDCHQSSNR